MILICFSLLRPCLHQIQYCDKEMDYKAVKKKWDSGISKNLNNLQGNFRNKSILHTYVDYNGLCLKENSINIKEDTVLVELTRKLC